MTDRNKNRLGYKKTKAGWIPEEWDCVHLRAVCNRDGQYGACASAIAFSAAKPRYVRITDILDVGRLQEDQLVSIEPAQSQGYELHVNDLLFARTGATVGKTYLHKTSQGSYAFAGYLIRFIPNLSSIIPSFLQAFTQSPKYWRWVAENLHAGAQPNINAEEYGALSIPLPPLPEQKKIAEILSIWDEGIEQTRQLIAAAKRRKKALMQKLLTGKKRLPGFTTPWVKQLIGDLFEEVARPVEWSDEVTYSLLSVRRASGGVFLRERLQGSQIQTKVMYVAQVGDFLISKMQVLHGATALVPPAFDGMHISGSYIALRPKTGARIDPDFFARLSSTPQFYHLTYLCSYGVHIEKMTFNLEWFLESQIRLPVDVEEQRAIAAVLDAADEEIVALESKLAAWEKQKRGLMQNLLTGRIRAKTEMEAVHG